MNKPSIKRANYKNFNNIIRFHNNYYKTNRNLKQFIWMFGNRNKENKVKNYYYSKLNNRIIGTIGFIKYDLVSSKIKVFAFKPEDVLVTIDGVKNKQFEKIYLKFKNSFKKKKIFFFNFSEIGWAFKKFSYKTNYGSRKILRKIYSYDEILKVTNKSNFPYIFKKIISIIVFLYSKITSLNYSMYNKKKIDFRIYNKCPFWVEDIFKKFLTQWKCFTIYRSKNFLKWRIFNNPYMKNNFVGIFYKQNPLGYFIYTIQNKHLYLNDLIISSNNRETLTKEILQEMVKYLEEKIKNQNLKSFNFEIYLEFKLNLLLKNILIKKGFLIKNKVSDFSYFKSNFNIKNVKKNLYISSILKSGR